MKRFLFFVSVIIFFKSVLIADYYNDYLDEKVVYFPTDKEPGSIVIITHKKRLYYILGDDMAYEFPIAVGKREEDRFYGVYPISAKAKWPSWRPTPSMLEKEPNLPKIVKGGRKNPLGARALYLGDSPYRIHGTNNPSSIGKAASHGCIRMYNRDVKELYRLVSINDMVYVK
jgi:lipoprotein-anchoring transpeptidase ErfK/SrfK